MRVMARQATEPPVARSVAFAQGHQEVVIEQQRLLPRPLTQRGFEQHQGFLQGSAGANIQVVLPRLQHLCVALLVASHADVIGQPTRKLCEVNDGRVRVAGERRPLRPLLSVQLPRPVAILAADRQFLEGRVLIEGKPIGHRWGRPL